MDKETENIKQQLEETEEIKENKKKKIKIIMIKCNC